MKQSSLNWIEKPNHQPQNQTQATKLSFFFFSVQCHLNASNEREDIYHDYYSVLIWYVLKQVLQIINIGLVSISVFGYFYICEIY